jgi:exopolyphosphatase/guanosine-5'-triphosphate,3'-diphosphate pyrophosphatase
VLCACIDIGSNTTRLLVADATPVGGLRRLHEERTFTRLGAGLSGSGVPIPPAKLAEVAAGVALAERRARELGAKRVAVVGTAALRRAVNRDELERAIRHASGVQVRVLEAADEARLAFAGATRGVAARGVAGGGGVAGDGGGVVGGGGLGGGAGGGGAGGGGAGGGGAGGGGAGGGGAGGGGLSATTGGALVAVVDVGGGSTEIAVGEPAGGGLAAAPHLSYCATIELGSLDMTEQIVAHDPPSAAELEALRSRAARAFADVKPPRTLVALAVGGSAASLARLAGERLDGASLGAALGALTGGPVAAVAAQLGLHAERVRLLPAGIALLGEASRVLGVGLELGGGGVREGVILELARLASPGASDGAGADPPH